MKVNKNMKSLLQEKLLTLYYRIFYSGVYNSIHKIPAFYWYKIEEEGDYLLLIKNENNRDRIRGREKRTLKWLESDKLKDAYKNILNQKIENFPPEEYYKDISIRKEIALMRYKAAAHNQRSLNTLANLKEMEYESRKKKSTEKLKDAFMKNVTSIEDRIKIKLNYLTISLFEYNNYLTVLSK